MAGYLTRSKPKTPSLYRSYNSSPRECTQLVQGRVCQFRWATCKQRRRVSLWIQSRLRFQTCLFHTRHLHLGQTISPPDRPSLAAGREIHAIPIRDLTTLCGGNQSKVFCKEASRAPLWHQPHSHIASIQRAPIRNKLLLLKQNLVGDRHSVLTQRFTERTPPLSPTALASPTTTCPTRTWPSPPPP